MCPAVTAHRDPPLGPPTTEPGAEGLEGELLAEAGVTVDLEHASADHPGVLVLEAARRGVVTGDVLHEVGQRIETSPTARAHVAEPHEAVDRVDPAHGGEGNDQIRSRLTHCGSFIGTGPYRRSRGCRYPGRRAIRGISRKLR